MEEEEEKGNRQGQTSACKPLNLLVQRPHDPKHLGHPKVEEETGRLQAEKLNSRDPLRKVTGSHQVLLTGKKDLPHLALRHAKTCATVLHQADKGLLPLENTLPTNQIRKDVLVLIPSRRIALYSTRRTRPSSVELQSFTLLLTNMQKISTSTTTLSDRTQNLMIRGPGMRSSVGASQKESLMKISGTLSVPISKSLGST